MIWGMINQIFSWAWTTSKKLNEPVKTTTPRTEINIGISYAIIWWRARNAPIKANLLLLAHPATSISIGERPKITNGIKTLNSDVAMYILGLRGITARIAAANERDERVSKRRRLQLTPCRLAPSQSYIITCYSAISQLLSLVLSQNFSSVSQPHIAPSQSYYHSMTC